MAWIVTTRTNVVCAKCIYVCRNCSSIDGDLCSSACIVVAPIKHTNTSSILPICLDITVINGNFSTVCNNSRIRLIAKCDIRRRSYRTT